jgi:hypothetical protein
MKEKLLNFINEYACKYHYDGDNEVYLFIYFPFLDSFANLFEYTLFANNILECILKDCCLCIKMSIICDHYNIELSEIFKK